MPAPRFRAAQALHQQGRLREARAAYEDILRHEPRHADALHGLGLLAAQQRRFDEALALIGSAIALGIEGAAAHANLGSALREVGRLPEALASYDRAIEIEPGHAWICCQRADLLAEQGHFEAALAGYGRALEMSGDRLRAHLGRAKVLRQLRRHEAALESCDEALAIRESAAVHLNRGAVLADLGRWQQALASYDRALALEPQLAEAHVNRAIAALTLGDLECGWAEYEWRWKLADTSSLVRPRIFSEPRWHGTEPLAGRSILLYGEQGLGDTLQFCRYVPLVAELGARVILEVRSPLLSLLADLTGVARLASTGSTLPPFDYQCPLLSLPLAFRTTLDTIPAPARYLSADQGKVAEWQALLGPGTRPRIGLVWSGSTVNTQGRSRSIAFAELSAHLPAGLQYVSLQKEVPEEDREALRRLPGLMCFGDRLHDFSDTAALCECLDLVITIDTSVAHLNAALGRKTWILLSYASDWRWLLDRPDSPWYPSVRLYRQAAPDDWHNPLREIGAALSALGNAAG